MKYLPFLLLALLAGCASMAQKRPVAEAYEYPKPDFSGVVDLYVTAVPDSVDLASMDPKPGVLVVHDSDPGLKLLHLNEPYSEQVAVREVLKGFTCPVRGKVYVTAMASKDGVILAPQLRRGIHPLCDAKAVEIMQRIQVVPAQWQGKPVAMMITLPVVFR